MATMEPFTPIIHRRFSMYSYKNPNYFHHNYTFTNRYRYRAFHGIPSHLLYDTVSFRLQSRVSKLHLWSYCFLKNRDRCTNIYVHSSREHDTDSTDQNDTSRPDPQKAPRPGRDKKKWWWKSKRNHSKWSWKPIIQAQEIGVLLVQLGIVVFVMRLLRPGIPLPGSEPRPPTTLVSVPYSDFLSKINNNQVQKVEVDGVHIMFKLKTEATAIGGVESIVSDVNSKLQDSDSLLRSVNPTKRIVYTTTRPSDSKRLMRRWWKMMLSLGLLIRGLVDS